MYLAILFAATTLSLAILHGGASKEVSVLEKVAENEVDPLAPSLTDEVGLSSEIEATLPKNETDETDK